jgi:hypothetical protein
MLCDRYFFEVPIYRIRRDRFDADYECALRHYWEWTAEATGVPRAKLSRETHLRIEQHFWERYGGPWQFNQAVGRLAAALHVWLPDPR